MGQLASIAEIARILDVRKATAARYANRADFPEPVGRVGAGPVWWRAAVETWGAANLPLPEGEPAHRREQPGAAPIEVVARLVEVADVLRVSVRTARRYSARPDFPQPLRRVARSRVWSRDDVEKWGRDHLQLSTDRRSRLRRRRPTEKGGLAGVIEVAGIMNVSKRSAARYVRRADFPAPIDRLAAGPVWWTEDVERWGRDHLPLPRVRRAAERQQDRGSPIDSSVT
jgi:predicted DNA-binding transcriptional regulator AlpA